MNSLKEIWRPIVGYEDLFEVSTRGRVRSKKTGKMKVLSKGTGGYVKVALSRNYVQKCLSVHRLVAEAFIPNPEGKGYVDHINTIRADNRVDNLRWVTKSENQSNPVTIERNRIATKKRYVKETKVYHV